jgi:DNA-binding NarL/FixJ family response regulator
MKTIRIALVEDNPTDMATLMHDFDRKGEIEVVHTFMAGSDFLNHFYENPIDFDALVIDYRLPHLNGLETCRNVIAKNSSFKHLLVSHGYYGNVMKEMMSMGSQNYCQKTGDVIHQLLPRIMEGKVTYEDPSQIHHWDGITRSSSLQTKDESYWAGNLSPLEKKIIRYVCEGHNSQVIAEALGYETSSIEKYRGSILKALDLKNSQLLTAWAFSHGITNGSIVFCPNLKTNQVSERTDIDYQVNTNKRSKKSKKK